MYSDAKQPDDEPTDANSNGGRGPGGQFLPGHKFSRGHSGPWSRASAGLKQAAMEAVTGEYMKKIMLAMAKRAIDGDVQAARFVYSYTIGAPVQGIEITETAEMPPHVQRAAFAAFMESWDAHYDAIDAAEGEVGE